MKESAEITEEIVGKRENPLDGIDTNGSSTNKTPGRTKLRSWLNKNFRIVMKDGRILIGVFLCTDFWGNIILGLCSEFSENDYERVLGLVMIPKKHIVSIEVDVAGSTPQAQTQENIVS